jgi:hypothetical protein
LPAGFLETGDLHTDKKAEPVSAQRPIGGHPVRQLVSNRSTPSSQSGGIVGLVVLAITTFGAIFGGFTLYQSYAASGNKSPAEIVATKTVIKYDFTDTLDMIDRRCISNLLERRSQNKNAGPDIAADALKHQGLKLVMSQPGPNGVSFGLKEAPGYLNCAINLMPERLCDRALRKALVTQIAAYQELRLHYASMVSSDAGQHVVSMQSKLDQLQSPPGKGISNVVTGGGDRHHLPDPRITDGVRKLSALGYLSKSDFGVLPGRVLKDIEASFVPMTTNSCQ